MIEVVVNADDFGLSNAVNYGIFDCHKNGLINSATMMMNAKATEHAIQLAKDTPSLKVGVHLVLTSGRPILHDVSSLVDNKGWFKKQLDILNEPKGISLEELEKEWSAQIDRFLDAGLVPTHFDSHHHMHGIPFFHPVVKRLSEKYQLPIRKVRDDLIDVPTLTDLFLDDFYGETGNQGFFKTLDERVKDCTSVEIMAHPAYLDEDLLHQSSYTHERLKEVSILMSEALPEGFILRK